MKASRLQLRRNILIVYLTWKRLRISPLQASKKDAFCKYKVNQ